MPKSVTKNVPESEVDKVMQDYRDDGADPVTKEKQPDGTYTVTATYPDKAETATAAEVGKKADTENPSGPAVAASAKADKAAAGKSLKKNGIPWAVDIDGKDLVVRRVKVTAFGGGHDTGDDGHTESGVMNDGSDPNLMGCALPIKANEAATKNSPLAFKPPISWHTKVRFWKGDDETKAIETELIDNGPRVSEYPEHAGDLTVAAAKKFAPTIPIEKMANAFEMLLSYRIVDGAKFANQS